MGTRVDYVALALRMKFHDLVCVDGFTCPERDIHAASASFTWVDFDALAKVAIERADETHGAIE